MYYGSVAYMLSIIILLIVTATVYLVLRKCKEKIAKLVIFSIMLVNVLQHLLKSVIYPIYFGQGFTAISSAYNMCAFLILISPAVFLSKSRLFKNFLYFVGTVAGIAAIAVPQWYIGKPISELGVSYFRFYLCHALLFISSIMPLLLGFHKPSYKEFWQVGLGFLFALCCIVINDFLFMATDLYPGADIHDFFDSMQRINPCGLMGPPKSLPWVAHLVSPFSPDFLLGDNSLGVPIPILWYAIPVYLGIGSVCAVLFAILDRRNFTRDISRLSEKFRHQKYRNGPSR